MVDPARRTGLLERTLGDISGCEISKADADSSLRADDLPRNKVIEPVP